MNVGFRKEDSVNLPAPFLGQNLYQSDPALISLTDAVPQAVADDLAQHGTFWGSQEASELGRLANEHAPLLRTHDAGGTRIDLVEFHPAYHALMRRSIAAGLHSSVWDAQGPESGVRTVARAARVYLAAGVEPGHLAQLATTNSAIAALGHTPRLAESWLPFIRSRRYDQSQRPVADKHGALLGLAITERQAGTDLRQLATIAQRVDSSAYRLTGHKWFVSGAMSDGFVTLAQTQEGISAFLMPRVLPDGSRNSFRFSRLKSKLGNRSQATAEIELDSALALLLGEAGHGVSAIAEMSALARLDSALVSAALMRMAVAEAVHHARQRVAFGQPLIAQPMMIRVLADIALDAVAAAALVFRLAEAFDRANDDPSEGAFARLMTPVTKYWVGKAAAPLIAEAMECIGGNAVVEESRLPRLYREAAAAAIDHGPGNVACLDVLRVLRKSSEALEAVLTVSANSLGGAAKTTINVLRAATAVALADEGSTRKLVEQLAMTVAAAALRRGFPAAIADAFLETRLGKEWRLTYGMLDSRFDARAFIDYLYPQQ
ncbi:MAG: acyl-CoA dehydrogenase family protein [Bauldia sp.]